MLNKPFFIFILFICLIVIISPIPAVSGILTVDLNTAKQAYLDADKKISNMQKEGYPTLPLLDSLNETEVRYNLGDYNLSYDISVNTISDADNIISLKEKLLNLTEDLKTLNTLGVDTGALDIQLLYAKSDFESANIIISTGEADELGKTINSLLFNYSGKYYSELTAYSRILEANNESPEFFKDYVKEQEQYYVKKRYSSFLKGFLNFESLKKIISMQAELGKNINVIKEENISFKRLDDSMALFWTYINSSDFKNAEKTISELNSLSKTAISLKDEMGNITIYYEKIADMGILDNKTAALFESARREFSLENYVKAKSEFENTGIALLSLEANNIIFGGIKKASIKKGLKDFFINNWLSLIIIAVIVILAYKPLKVYSFLKYSIYQRRKLTDEKEAIETLQIEIQRQYYVEHFLDKKTYKEDFVSHEERKAEIQNRFKFLEEKSFEYTDYLEKIKNVAGLFGKLNPQNKK